MEQPGDIQGHLSRGVILQAAAKVFADKGYADATVEDLLVEGGLSRRTFYKYFSGKEEVLQALHELASGMFLQATRDALAGATTPLERVGASIDVYLAFAQRSGRLMLVVQGEARRSGSALEGRRQRAIADLSELLQEGIRAHHGRRADPLLLHGVLLALEGVTQAILAEGPPSPEAIQRARRVMLRIAVGAMHAPGDPQPPMPYEPGD